MYLYFTTCSFHTWRFCHCSSVIHSKIFLLEEGGPPDLGRDFAVVSDIGATRYSLSPGPTLPALSSICKCRGDRERVCGTLFGNYVPNISDENVPLVSECRANFVNELHTRHVAIVTFS